MALPYALADALACALAPERAAATQTDVAAILDDDLVAVVLRQIHAEAEFGRVVVELSRHC